MSSKETETEDFGASHCSFSSVSYVGKRPRRWLWIKGFVQARVFEVLLVLGSVAIVRIVFYQDAHLVLAALYDLVLKWLYKN